MDARCIAYLVWYGIETCIARPNLDGLDIHNDLTPHMYLNYQY